MRAGVPRRRARRTPPAAVSTTVPSSSAERLGEHVDVDAGIGDERDLVDGRVASELRRRSERGQPAAVDDRDTVAQRFRLVHRVRGQQHGHAAVAQRSHELPRGRACVRVHARGRLVEEHDARAAR